MPECFTPLSSRLLSSSSGDGLFSASGSGPVGPASWAPLQDLLALSSADGATHLHRLAWARVLSAPREAHKGARDGLCSTTGVAWRPDGKALALACRCGRISLLSVESRAIVDVWLPAAAAPSADSSSPTAATHDSTAPITCLRWVESLTSPSGASPAAPRASDAALLQALYLRAQGDAPRGVHRACQEQEAAVRLAASSVAAASTAAASSYPSPLPPAESLPRYFDTSLPSLEAALELFQAQGLASGAAMPSSAGGNSAAASQHRSARQQAGGSGAGPNGGASGSSSALRGVLHDALDLSDPSHSPLLLVGDARGRYWVRAFGTVDLLAGHIESGAAVVDMDWCGVSGMLSVVARQVDADPSASSTHPLTLHALSCPALLTAQLELLYYAQQVQQIHCLSSYLLEALNALQSKWSAARKAFVKKMSGLADVIESQRDERGEWRRERAETGEESSDEDDDEQEHATTPQLELLEYLSTGIPSYALLQFVTGYLSSGPLSKTLASTLAALDESAALVHVCVLPALEQLTYRAEQLRAWVATGGGFATVGLNLPASSSVLASVSEVWERARSLLGLIGRSRELYDSFGGWMLSAVRLMNNEHEASQTASAAEEAEEAKEGDIPVYGPFNTASVQLFLQTEWEADTVGEAIGSVGTTASPDSATTTTLCGSFALFQSSFTSFLTGPRQTLSGACKKLDVLGGSTSSPQSLTLLSAPRLTPAWLPQGGADTSSIAAASVPAPSAIPAISSSLQPSHALLGSSRTIALRHVTAAQVEGHKHMVAFLWQPEGQGQEHGALQCVSVLQYRSISTTSPALLFNPDAVTPLPATHLTLFIPAHPSVADASSSPDSRWQSQVVSVQFYSDTSLALMVQYEELAAAPEEETAGGAASATATATNVCTKVWMVDLEATEEAQWNEVPDTTAASDSLASSIASQLASGAAHLLSLLPVESSPSPFPLCPTSVASTRSRLFPSQLGGALALNGHRGLGALMLAARGAPAAPSSAAQSDKGQASLLLQAPFKATRRVMLLDMQEDPEEEEEEEVEEEADAAEAGAEVDEGDVDADADATAADGGDAAEESYAMMDESRDSTGDAAPSTPAKPTSARSSMGGSGSRRKGLASATSSPMMLSLMLQSMLLCLSLLCLLASPVLASEGDRSPSFRSCLGTCTARCRVLDQAVLAAGHPAGTDPFAVLDPETLGQWEQQQKQQLLKRSTSVEGVTSASASLSSNDATPWPPSLASAASPRPLSWLERSVCLWDCPANCAYHCMHANEAQRLKDWIARKKSRSPPRDSVAAAPDSSPSVTAEVDVSDFPVWKYYGKWPFVRLLGMQEFFSSVFSILNALPHVFNFFIVRRLYGEGSALARKGVRLPMLNLWFTYALIYTNTWLWSTVFHARDTWWSERLDYFCASLGLTWSLCVVALRLLGRAGHGVTMRSLVILPLMAGFLTHIGYLHFIHFDYGWNMLVSVSVGVVHSILWVAFCWRHWRDGYHGRILFVTLALWACAALELFDFAPRFGGLLDAHAVWHGLTPALGWQFWKWVKEDLKAQSREAEREVLKRG